MIKLFISEEPAHTLTSTMHNIKKKVNGMFFKIFSFIFYAGAIKPVLTFEYFGFVFSLISF